nr:MAG TPA: hypothetical protein [Caudoviricetes sp.]
MAQTDYNEIAATNVAKPKTDPTPTDGKVEVAERQPKKALVTKSSTEEIKPSLMTRLVKGLIGPNGVRAILGYLGKEVIAPAIKDTVVNSITTGVNMMAYGEDRRPYNNGGWNNPMRTQGVQGSRTYTNYTSAYHNTAEPTPVNAPGRIKDIYLFTHEDAQVVLNSLNVDIMNYGYARLADYYDYAGQPSTNYTDNSYGWRNLQGVRIIPVRGKYTIALPPVEVI